MTDTAWKRTERRRIAALLGGQRVPITGRARGDVPDVAHDTLSIECKHRLSIPAWLTDALAQAEAAAAPDQLPIVVVHQHGSRYDRALVVLRLSAFVAHLDGRGDDA
jgi:hypothetical protein